MSVRAHQVPAHTPGPGDTCATGCGACEALADIAYERHLDRLDAEQDARDYDPEDDS
jgi:hypothetical protein